MLAIVSIVCQLVHVESMPTSGMTPSIAKDGDVVTGTEIVIQDCVQLD